MRADLPDHFIFASTTTEQWCEANMLKYRYVYTYMYMWTDWLSVMTS